MVITRTRTSAEKEAQPHDSGPGRAWAHRGRDKLVRSSSRGLAGPARLPSLGTVQEDPTILAGLPLTVIVDLRRQVSHLAADLDAVLFNAVADARRPDHHAEVRDNRLLTPAEAAARFGVTKRWLLDHAGEMPGVKRLSRKTIRFSERRLARYLDRTPG